MRRPSLVTRTSCSARTSNWSRLSAPVIPKVTCVPVGWLSGCVSLLADRFEETEAVFWSQPGGAPVLGCSSSSEVMSTMGSVSLKGLARAFLSSLEKRLFLVNYCRCSIGDARDFKKKSPNFSRLPAWWKVQRQRNWPHVQKTAKYFVCSGH